MSTFSSYPYAPLTPLAAATLLHTEAISYGIGLGVEGGIPSEKTDSIGERVVLLATRVQRDALVAQGGPLKDLESEAATTS